MDFSECDLRSLASMLKTEESSDSEDDLPNAGVARMGPGHIGIKNTRIEVSETGGGDGKTEEAGDDVKSNIDKAIWSESEVGFSDCTKYDECEDPRLKPEFDIKYRQSVTAEDVYLQMGMKTPATSSCEDMIISIQLTDESNNNVDIDVLSQVLELRSPKYRLSLPLPHPVDSKVTKAVWKDSVLEVTLRLKREFDFVNF